MILFILPSGRMGGAEKVMMTTLENLSRREFSLHLAFVSADGPLLKSIPEDIPTYSLGGKRLIHSLGAIIRLVRCLRPDIVFTSLYGLNISVLLIKPFLPSRTKIIIRESNLPSVALANEKYPKLLRRLISWSYPKADRIIALGNAMQLDLINTFKIPCHKTVVIPNPVDQSQLQDMAHNTSNPFDAQKFNFLAVGSLRQQKGFDLLIESMAMVVFQCPQVHLTIIGDGPLRSSLQNLIEENKLTNFVTLAGYQSNPYPYFYHADRFVLSSRSEGLPNAVLESLSLGTPVFALDTPGCIHDIITNEAAGNIVHPPTTTALATEMLQTIGHAKPSTSSGLLSKRFHLQTVMNDYINLFMEC
jgi:glycosyltransferase involved in cell wall biosynthesis